MQGQYRTHAPYRKCTFRRQDCTFQRLGRHRHNAWQAQSSWLQARSLPLGSH
ncbi:hypothetical protein C4J94_3494 [Pseudomonas sp. R5-89-07]|nr:hypothetical protein C4J94_3494 [Pseudomonas sp. R5-89-07]